MPTRPTSRWRTTPAVLAGALVLTFRAAPLLASAALALQVLAASSSGLLLVLLDRLLGAALAPAAQASHSWPEFTVLGVLLTVAVSAQFLQNALRVLVTERVTWHANQQLLDVATVVDQATFDTPSFHDRLNRAQGAVTRPAMMTDGLFSVIGGLSATAGLTVVVAGHEPDLLLVLLATAIPLLLATSHASRRLHGTLVGLVEDDRRRSYLTSLLTSRLTSAEIRGYGLAGHLRAYDRSLFNRRAHALTRTISPAALLTVLGGVLAAAGVVGSVAAVVAQVRAGSIPPASASLVAVALLQLNGALTGLLGGWSRLYENSLFLDDLRTFRTQLTIGCRRPTGPAPTTIDRVAVDRVSFRYPGSAQPVLRDVSLSLRRGEVVALVGGNGSGKTTLAKLLCNLYRPEAGQIRWDGRDVAAMDPDAARSAVAALHQDFAHYLMTIAENIGLGRTDRMTDHNGIRSAAQQAGASAFVDDLPTGYATPLGSIFKGSVDLSGGQWQRLALARALFRDAALLVLDEPTAALDACAENEFFQTLRELAADRAVVLISHRMTGVRSADRIYVLDAGCIVEEGTHDELMARGGRYTDLHRAHESTSGLTAAALT